MALRFLLALALSSLARPALAAGPQLTWRAPAECPDRASVLAAVDRTRPPEVDLAAMIVDAEVTHEDGGYRLALSMQTPSGKTERRLLAERCDTLAEVVALELGMASAADAQAAPPVPTLWGARAAGGLGTGPGPGIAPRVAVTGLLQRRRLRIELGAGFNLPSTTRYESPPDVGARFSALSGQLRGCYVATLEEVEVSLCGGLEAGVWRGKGVGVDNATSATRPWVGLSVGAGLRYPRRSMVAVFIGLDGVLGLVRPTFGFRNLPPLYQPARLSVRGSLGVELHFD